MGYSLTGSLDMGYGVCRRVKQSFRLHRVFWAKPGVDAVASTPGYGEGTRFGVRGSLGVASIGAPCPSGVNAPDSGCVCIRDPLRKNRIQFEGWVLGWRGLFLGVAQEQRLADGMWPWNGMGQAGCCSWGTNCGGLALRRGGFRLSLLGKFEGVLSYSTRTIDT